MYITCDTKMTNAHRLACGILCLPPPTPAAYYRGDNIARERIIYQIKRRPILIPLVPKCCCHLVYTPSKYIMNMENEIPENALT